MHALLDWRLPGLALAGALLSLDRRAAVQAMLAHPIVASAIAGWLLGDLRCGLFVGLLLGLLWSGSLPVGGVVPPDETLGAVVATGVAILGARAAGADLFASAFTGFLAGIPAAFAGRRLELALRRYNGEIAREVEKRVRAGDLAAIESATLRALGVAFAGALLVYGIALAICVPAAFALLSRHPALFPTLAKAAFPVPIAGAGAVIAGAGFRLGLAWATLGFAIGLLLLTKGGPL